MSRPHSTKIGWPMGQKETGVETTYDKAQRESATCQIDQRPRQECGESLDAVGIGPVTLEINWGGLCSAVDSNRLIWDDDEPR